MTAGSMVTGLRPGPNWVDDGALSLGIASYALVEGDEALIYDTHVSVPYAQLIRERLEADGVRKFTVVLSHWHLDHVAGTAAFADCDIIANRRTTQHLTRHKAAIEAGTHHGPPAIDPLILPTRLFDGQHATDARRPRNPADRARTSTATTPPCIWLPAERILLAGDTLEDTVTYVGEPREFRSPPRGPGAALRRSTHVASCRTTATRV